MKYFQDGRAFTSYVFLFCFFFSLTTFHNFSQFRVACLSGHPQPLPTDHEGWSHFPAMTVKGRRSCLLMAPGACGSRLANQCESTSGTSLAQTILLRAHSASCQKTPPSLYTVRFPSKPGTLVHAHTRARHFPKHSQSSWHPGLVSPFYPLTCSANTAKSQRAAPACQRARLWLDVGGLRCESLYELPGKGLKLPCLVMALTSWVFDISAGIIHCI